MLLLISPFCRIAAKFPGLIVGFALVTPTIVLIALSWTF